MRNISGSAGASPPISRGVVGVVAADADHLAARDDRREQPHVLQRHLVAGGHDRLVERVALDLGDHLLPGLAVDDAVGRVLTCRVSRDAHGTRLPTGPVPLDPVVVRTVPEPVWRSLERAHEQRVDALTAEHLTRRAGGRRHPVEDFLFTYYSHRPAQLRRWHPGAGVALAGARRPARAGASTGSTATAPSLDVEALLAARGESVRFVRDLLARTASRPAQLGCFGLHEWAMVYRQDPEQVRHADWPLRLGADGHGRGRRVAPDPLLALRRLPLLHAAGPAAQRPHADTRGTRRTWSSRAACTPTWTSTSGRTSSAPAVPSELSLDCFELARDVRELDMRASPYDLRELGYEPVRIETPRGQGGVRRRAARLLGARTGAARPARGRLRRCCCGAGAPLSHPCSPLDA